MVLKNFVRAPVLGVLLMLSAGSQAFAQQGQFASEGTFDIPAGAKFNPEKLAKITAFFKNEVDTGKISGADVLIRQRGKDVYHETFGVQDVVSKTPCAPKSQSASDGRKRFPVGSFVTGCVVCWLFTPVRAR